MVIVALNEDEPSDDELVGMLNLVLSPDMPKEKKIKDLGGRYNVPVKGDAQEPLERRSLVWPRILGSAFQRDPKHAHLPF